MNILFVETSLNPNLGGIERVTYILSHEFERNGNSCYYTYIWEDYNEIPEHKKIRINYTDDFVKFECSLLDFIRDNNIRIVINQDLYSKYFLNFYRIHKNQLGIKLINCFHLSPDFYEYQKIKGKKHQLKYWIYKCLLNENLFIHERNQMYDICDNFVLLSESFIEDFKKRYKTKTDTITSAALIHAILRLETVFSTSGKLFQQNESGFYAVYRRRSYAARVTRALAARHEPFYGTVAFFVSQYPDGRTGTRLYARKQHVRRSEALYFTLELRQCLP